MQLPAGPVTFCFTDIEGSTRLARRDPDEWVGLLRQHNQLLHAVWQAHGGLAVKAEGDALFVVFRSPLDAVVAAAAAQRAVAEAKWPEDASLRVRIGLHSGTAVIDNDDYVGAEVHRAARIAAAAHGGQVLLSGITADSIEDGLPADLRLREVGTFALKGFEEGDRLVQLVVDGTGDSRPPRALPVEAHNIPLLATTFVGREVERVDVAKMLDTHRLVTVVATGGTGKTRLALEVGRSIAPDYAGGVWAVFFASEPTGGDVVGPVARTLGVADVEGLSTLDALVQWVNHRNVVLVLDNCEHVIDAASTMVAALLERCPELRVLATSRQPLDVYGEKVFELAPMGTPVSAEANAASVRSSEAGELFMERATRANPKFRLTDENAVDVAGLCHALGGLPLAIELAAAATRTIPVRTLAERIPADLGLLRTASASQPPRQRTIEALIGWSYDLLNAAQAACFRRLAVFRGGWDLPAAEAVCAAGGVAPHDVVLLLGDLVDRSLVLLEADGRYRMLVLVRAYAQTRLDEAGEAANAADAHMSHFGDRAVAGTTPEALATIGVDVDNFAVAFDRAILASDATTAARLAGALGSYLYFTGHYERLDDALARLEPILEDGSDRVHNAVNRANMARLRGDHRTALEHCGRAVDVAKAFGEPDLIAMAISERSEALVAMSDPVTAAQEVREALELQCGTRARGALLGSLFQALAVLDDPSSVEVGLEAADLLDQAGDYIVAVHMRLGAAEKLATRGDVDLAREVVGVARAFAERGSVPRLLAIAQYVTAFVARHAWATDDDASLLVDLADAEAVCAELGDAPVRAAVLGEQLLLHVALGAWPAAEASLERLVSQLDAALDVLPEVTGGAALLLARRQDPRAGALAAFSLRDGKPGPRLRPGLEALAEDSEDLTPEDVLTVLRTAFTG